MKTRRGETATPELGSLSLARPGEPMYANYNYDAITIAFLSKEVVYDEYSSRRLHPRTPFYQMINGKYCRVSGSPCLEDADKDGDFDKPGKDPETLKKIDVPYELVEEFFDASSEGFRSELVFQGIAAGVLRLAYREFVNDMARPAFTQVLTYDYSGPTTLAFQSLEFEILEAGNMGITYRVREAESSLGP